MVVEASEYQFSPYDITGKQLDNRLLPIVLDWAIGNTTCEDAQTNKSSYACRSDHRLTILTNVPTKIDAPSQESVTIFKELIGAVVLSVGVIMMTSKNVISTWQ
ncbi:hypothetical protein FCM35_KLT22261 [Carex littledalei]|uniref:Uncharacterized protein n=1 Tax=Carex littledalei TaxID=544730 RepID=A0A833QDZ8_9POAL|nr:hypothetical protein FCM35_KLT22261 [Carex littledalei]